MGEYLCLYNQSILGSSFPLIIWILYQPITNAYNPNLFPFWPYFISFGLFVAQPKWNNKMLQKDNLQRNSSSLIARAYICCNNSKRLSNVSLIAFNTFIERSTFATNIVEVKSIQRLPAISKTLNLQFYPKLLKLSMH